MLTNLLIGDLQATAAHGGDARIIVVTSSFHDPDSKKKNGNWNRNYVALYCTTAHADSTNFVIVRWAVFADTIEATLVPNYTAW